MIVQGSDPRIAAMMSRLQSAAGRASGTDGPTRAADFAAASSTEASAIGATAQQRLRGLLEGEAQGRQRLLDGLLHMQASDESAIARTQRLMEASLARSGTTGGLEEVVAQFEGLIEARRPQIDEARRLLGEAQQRAELHLGRREAADAYRRWSPDRAGNESDSNSLEP